ncbi:MAG: BON domain-containing protein, partial [Acetobacteraceae bacterium]|nr:BON domain-containing protein [Acetobacteraceae bacterium]
QAVSTQSATDVQQKIEDALLRSAAIEAARITAEAQGRTIILRGAVNSWTERELAEQAAWAAPGVSRIENRIKVIPRLSQSQSAGSQEQAPVFSSDES